jgi:hypothetical protein
VGKLSNILDNNEQNIPYLPNIKNCWFDNVFLSILDELLILIKYNFIFNTGSFLSIKEEFDIVFMENCLLSIMINKLQIYKLEMVFLGKK